MDQHVNVRLAYSVIRFQEVHVLQINVLLESHAQMAKFVLVADVSIDVKTLFVVWAPLVNHTAENVFVHQTSLEIQNYCACHVSINYTLTKDQALYLLIILKNIFLNLAITNPICEPPCGKSAHCKYGLFQNSCECNEGTVGNPYEVCGAQRKNSCANTQCGAGAECRESANRVECVCPSGYTGNPYVQCHDVDECTENPCGGNSVCINTPGSYDCRCRPGYVGNPFIVCSPVQKDLCDDPAQCQCGTKAICPSGFTCENGRCRNQCDHISCGPRAVCSLGQCVCPLGYIGDPNDTNKGCYVRGQCQIDHDCKNSEICFQLGKGLRKCVDACSKFQCGPNALCVSSNHRSSCICSTGFVGNPNDLQIGCQPELRTPSETCHSNSDCQKGHICVVGPSGLHDCVNPCATVACGTNEQCQLDTNSNPVCHCKDSYVWNPVSSSCEKPSIPDCRIDSDCHSAASCRADVLGILKCTPICASFQCPVNSVCIAENHQGVCQCLPGFIGNPNDRNGCRTDRQNQCSTSAECPESEKCVKDVASGLLQCRSACDDIRCGPHAVCITNNHVAQCQCPPGPYDGDPYNVTHGCQSVPCVYNHDCPPTKLCNRLTHTCYNVCDEQSCGENAICIAENQHAVCQCPPGYRGDPIPDFGCKPTSTCNDCAPSAICEVTPSGNVCKCPQGFTGFPDSSGCFPIGQCPNGDKDCPSSAHCLEGRCIDKCEGVCGPNMKCTIKNNEAVCLCPSHFKFVSNLAKDGCIRDAPPCVGDAECGGGICYQGQCTVACRNINDCADGEHCVNNKCLVQCSSHSQCPQEQACKSGSCVIGCRSNKDCPESQACYNSVCENLCHLENACGPNALCEFKDHRATCKCPAGFEGNPTPEQGCVRIPAPCVSTNQCPSGHMCIANQCNVPCADSKSCAIGERCANNQCAKVCYTNNNCLPGEICNDSGTCQPGCQSDTDCPTSKICASGKCKCGRGFIGTPFGCTDIDECTEKPCHGSARCDNIPGSFRCTCPDQTVGDPYAAPGCALPNQCARDSDCAKSLECAEGKCTDPCGTRECGRNAICQAVDHGAVCSCPPGNLGDPTDKSIGCFRVECVSSEDCSVDKQCNPSSNKCHSK